MAKKKSKRKSKSSSQSNRTFQKEIAGLLLGALGVATLLTLLGMTRGTVGDAWALFLRRIFGWGSWVMALASLTAGGLLLLRHDLLEARSLWQLVVGLEGLLVSGLGLTHSLTQQEDPLLLAQEGGGGGYIGWAINRLLETAVGHPATILSFSLALLGFLFLTVSPYRMNIARLLRRGVDGVDEVLQDHTVEWEEEPPLTSVKTEKQSEPPRAKAKSRQKKRTKKPRAAAPGDRRGSKERHPKKRDSRLPGVEIFKKDGGTGIDTAAIRYRTQVIEETLASFGVPVKVVEVRQGPAITQFGVEPGYVERSGRDGRTEKRRVRVNKISTLSNDLALALAASPIRIEAPVPGRSVVGIEVPNTNISLVGLRGILESENFLGIKSNLRIALGRDVAGEPTVVDLGTMPHLLIAGATGSGKSVCINSVIACLLYENTPDELQLLMIDPKRVELTNFNGIPHLLAPVIVEVDEVVGALRWITREMDRRYKLFSEARKRNLNTYNRAMAARKDGHKLPHIIVIIDELADLMLTSPEEIERSVCRIAQMARATGIHLVMATQRPSVDVVTGLIKANFPARISFAVTSLIDSRVVLDSPGAEKLLGRGDMLFMAPDSSKLTRLQGCFVSDVELDRLAKFWRRSVAVPSVEPEEAPWQEESFLESENETDKLLAEAIELVQEQGKASTSWLQRQFRIGYPRAARLMDDLEEMGIVGPPGKGGRGRQVLPSDSGGDESPDANHDPEPQ